MVYSGIDMADLSISAGGHGLVKDAFVIFLGAALAAFVVWAWDMSVGKALANATANYGGVNVAPGA